MHHLALCLPITLSTQVLATGPSSKEQGCFEIPSVNFLGLHPESVPLHSSLAGCVHTKLDISLAWSVSSTSRNRKQGLSKSLKIHQAKDVELPKIRQGSHKTKRQERKKDEGELSGDTGKVDKGSLIQPCPETNSGMTLTQKTAFLFSHWLDFYT